MLRFGFGFEFIRNFFSDKTAPEKSGGKAYFPLSKIRLYTNFIRQSLIINNISAGHSRNLVGVIETELKYFELNCSPGFDYDPQLKASFKLRFTTKSIL